MVVKASPKVSHLTVSPTVNKHYAGYHGWRNWSQILQSTNKRWASWWGNQIHVLKFRDGVSVKQLPFFCVFPIEIALCYIFVLFSDAKPYLNKAIALAVQSHCWAFVTSSVDLTVVSPNWLSAMATTAQPRPDVTLDKIVMTGSDVTAAIMSRRVQYTTVS